MSEHKQNSSWNKVVENITIGINQVTKDRLQKVCEKKKKRPESVIIYALSRYLDRYNKMNKTW